MLGKFYFGGDGVKVPGTDFGLSFGIFKAWLCPSGGEFKGYTTASNQGLLGFAIVESPVVEFNLQVGAEEDFTNLAGQTVDVTIDSNTFIKNGGVATINLIVKSNIVAEKSLTFFSDECKGYSAMIGNAHFTATLVELLREEWDPRNLIYVPW